MPASQTQLLISEITQYIEEKAPIGSAEKWDNVGLLVGDPSWRTAGAILAIDLTEQAISLAKKKGYRLIINHHPCIFPSSKGLSRVVSSGSSHLIFRALEEGIAVVAAHTNFDQCALEVPRQIADALGINIRGRLIDSSGGLWMKLVVFVPGTHLESVSLAVGEAGAGHIGNYDFCSFSAAGEGRFRALQGARPFIGKPGALEKNQEYRLEVIFPRGLKASILQALRASHPYEEVAFDIFSVDSSHLQFTTGMSKGLGYGFWGDFLKPKTFSELSQSVKDLFKLSGYWMTQPLPKRINRVGFVAGKGDSFIRSAQAAGCDLFLTGEAGYHPAREGALQGIAVMEIGHRESEKFFLKTMKKWLSEIELSSYLVDLPIQTVFKS